MPQAPVSSSPAPAPTHAQISEKDPCYQTVKYAAASVTCSAAPTPNPAAGHTLVVKSTVPHTVRSAPVGRPPHVALVGRPLP